MDSAIDTLFLLNERRQYEAMDKTRYKKPNDTANLVSRPIMNIPSRDKVEGRQWKTEAAKTMHGQ